MPHADSQPITGVRFADLQSRPTEVLDITSLTLDEFPLLLAPIEAAWHLDGKPRTTRGFPVYQTCPLPTPEDRLLFLRAYVKTYALPVVQGRLFNMGQSTANQWMHVLVPALRTLGDPPARSLMILAQRLGVSEADAATVITSLAEAPAALIAAPAAGAASSLVPMTGRNDASSAPKTLLNRPHGRAARQRTTRSKCSVS